MLCLYEEKVDSVNHVPSIHMIFVSIVVEPMKYRNLKLTVKLYVASKVKSRSLLAFTECLHLLIYVSVIDFPKFIFVIVSSVCVHGHDIDAD